MQDSITPQEMKLLGRLKLSLWFVTILFVIHGLAGAFPEIYPLTRWAMFSEAMNGPKELREGYFIQYELRATDITGETYSITEQRLYSRIRLTTAAPIMAFVTMHYASQLEEPELQAEHSRTIFTQLDSLYNVEMESVEVWRLYYGIDYDRFPHVDYSQADHTVKVAVLTDGGSTIEVFDHDPSNPAS